MEQMRDIISGSVICRGLTALYLWCAAGWRGSCTARLWHGMIAWLSGLLHGCAVRLKGLTAWLEGSLIWRLAMALCAWCGRQWRSSGLVQRFLHPRGWTSALSEGSALYRLWSRMRAGLCRLYERLGLERVFAGSVFGYTWFWCMIPAALAPLIPTMAVLALEGVGVFALLLALARDRERELAWSPVNRYVILYAAVCLAAAFCSVDLESSLKPGLLTAAFILFAVVLFNAVTSRRQLDVIVTMLLLAAAAVSFYGILQYLFGWGYQSSAWVDSDLFTSIGFRAASTLENPNMLGQYLVLMIPLGGARLLSARTGRSRLGWLMCCGVMCVCMLLTMSRGAWLGLLAAGAAFFVMLDARLALLAPPAAVAVLLALPSTVFTRLTSIGNFSDASTSYRFYIWQGTLAMLKDFWLCGVGPGDTAFNKVYPVYALDGVVTPHSHNLYLQIICDAGIAALVVFLIAMFVYFRMMGSSLSRERDWAARLHLIALISGALGFLVQGLTDFSFYNYRVLFLFWTCLALGALYAGYGHLSKGGRET